MDGSYAVILKGTWHMVTSRKVGSAKVRELWTKRSANTTTQGFPTLRALGCEWDYVSRMH